MTPRIAIVILNWNGKAHLETFLPSVIRNSPSSVQIIVGDNGSTDDSLNFLSEHFPPVRVIPLGANLGFAGGYNAILRQVEADYFVLLNSDVEVTENWIIPVIDLMEQHELIGAVQPKILAYKDKHKFEHAGAAGGYIDVLGYPFCAGRILDTTEVDNGQYQEDKEIFWATGAALFIKRRAWEQAGGFDADFFAHMEEIDLCWRLKILGYQVWYCATSTVYHVGGGTLQKENPFKTYLNFRNNLLMLQKNLPFWQAVFTLFIRFWLDFLALIRFLSEGKTKDAQAINKAHVNFFRNFWKTAKKRKQFRTFGMMTGVYKGSIIWAYYIKKKKSFTDLQISKLYRN